MFFSKTGVRPYIKKVLGFVIAIILKQILLIFELTELTRRQKMQTKNFALIGGLVMIMMGIIALIPAMNVTEGLPPLVVNTSYGMFMDIFPMNIFNKAALIIFGIAGMWAYFNPENNLYYSTLYAKVVFWVMGALAVLGLFPQTNTLFGYWPLFGFEIIAHGIFALAGAYYGYIVHKTENYRTTPHRMHKV